MDTKLTLKLDRDVIEQAKRYAARRGSSLSEMVESYFASLICSDAVRPEPTGVVAELASLLRGAEIADSKEGYAEYLSAKYS